MPITVFSVKNFLKTCALPYFIRSACSDTIEADQMIDIMAQGRTTLSKPDIAGCMQLFVEELINQVADGKHVKTAIGAFYLSAGGKLSTPDQAFTPGVGDQGHALTLHFRTNKAVEAAMKQRARWDRIEIFDHSAAAVQEVVVVNRGSGEAAQAGDTLRITGRRLKFDPADDSCGVYLESGSGSRRCAVYPDVEPSKLIAILPVDLNPGSYTLLVATRPNGKDLKEGYYGQDFEVA